MRLVFLRTRRLFSEVGQQLFLFSLLMRLPTYMIALAVLLMMANRTGEATLGAYAAGLVALSSSMTHRTYRALSQRWGLRLVTIIAATLNIPAVAFLMVQTMKFSDNKISGSMTLLMVAAACAGATTAPLGAMMRNIWGTRYTHNADRRLLIASTAFESILDVIALPLAAAIVGLVAILGGIQSSLFAVIVINSLGLMFVVFKPSTFDFSHPVGAEMRVSIPRRYGAQSLGRFPMMGTACLGIAIGATQSALLVRAIQTDALGKVGIYMGALGAAGALTCVVLLALLPRFTTWEGWLIVGIGLILSSLLLSIPDSGLWLSVVIGIFGAVIGAALMCMDTLVTRLSARENVELAHSSVQSTYVGGLALGYVWAVIFSNLTGPSAAMLVPLIAATVFFMVGHLFGARWRTLYEDQLHLLPADQL